MTNRRQSPGNRKRGHNICDGQAPRPKSPDFLEKVGFHRTDFNKWNFTLGGKAPVFYIRPGIVGVKEGLVATHGPSLTEILFPYITTLPTDIAERLAAESLTIMRHDEALAEEALLCREAEMLDEGIMVAF